MGVVDEPHAVGGGAGSLEERGKERRPLLDVFKFHGIVVVEDDVHGEHLLLRVCGQRRDAAGSGVVDHENGDGLPLVDFLSEIRLRQKAVEGQELGGFVEDLGNVELCRGGRGRRRKGEKECGGGGQERKR